VRDVQSGYDVDFDLICSSSMCYIVDTLYILIPSKIDLAKARKVLV